MLLNEFRKQLSASKAQHEKKSQKYRKQILKLAKLVYIAKKNHLFYALRTRTFSETRKVSDIFGNDLRLWRHVFKAELFGSHLSCRQLDCIWSDQKCIHWKCIKHWDLEIKKKKKILKLNFTRCCANGSKQTNSLKMDIVEFLVFLFYAKVFFIFLSFFLFSLRYLFEWEMFATRYNSTFSLKKCFSMFID